MLFSPFQSPRRADDLSDDDPDARSPDVVDRLTNNNSTHGNDDDAGKDLDDEEEMEDRGGGGGGGGEGGGEIRLKVREDLVGRNWSILAGFVTLRIANCTSLREERLKN